MIKLFKEAFKTSNDCIILTIPLVFFMWIITLYIAFSSTTISAPVEFAIALVTLLFMLGAFFSGWFYMAKKAIAVSQRVYVLDEDRAKDTMRLFKEIPTGIGLYFLSFIGMCVLFLIIIALSSAFVSFVGGLIIGNIDFTPQQLQAALNAAQGVDKTAFLSSLTLEQKLKLSDCIMLIVLATTALSFLFILWIPEIIYSTPNPFVALLKSIKKLFCKFLNSLKLFVYLTFLNVLLTLLGALALLNPILYLFVMVLYFYFLIYVVVLLFSYYEREFCDKGQVEEA